MTKEAKNGRIIHQIVTGLMGMNLLLISFFFLYIPIKEWDLEKLMIYS